MKARQEVLVIDGPTGAGKSTLLRYIRQTKSDRFRIVKKLTTRDRRARGDDDHRFVANIPNSDELLAYRDVGASYAIDLGEIEKLRAKSLIATFVCTHTGVLAELKKRYRTLAVYVHRPTDEETLRRLMLRRGVTADANIEQRLAELAELAGRYSDRIMLYDHVILNIWSIDVALIQIDKICSAQQ